MEMLKIEQVIVGGEKKSTQAEIKPGPVVPPLQSYQHESLQCFQCFITFSDAKTKERHMRKSHRDMYKMQLQQSNTLFTCYKCDKSFSSSEELSLHQTSHDTGEKPFLCTYCQKTFYTFTELNKHKRRECIERRCPCSDCGALFPSPSRLRNHRVSVHPQSPATADDINTYQCCKCGHGFQTEEKLLQHQEKFANDLNCDTKVQGKKRGRKPRDATQGADGKKIKQDQEADDSPTEGCYSNELQPELKIPCPEANCDLIFPSVAALRAHKKEGHGPPLRKSHEETECDESNTQPHMTRAQRSGRTHTEGENATEKR